MAGATFPVPTMWVSVRRMAFTDLSTVEMGFDMSIVVGERISDGEIRSHVPGVLFHGFLVSMMFCRGASPCSPSFLLQRLI